MTATATDPACKLTPTAFTPDSPERLLEELLHVKPTILEITPSAPLPVTGFRRWRVLFEVTLFDGGLHPEMEKILAEKKTAPTATPTA